MIGADGKLAGFDIDLTEDLCKRAPSHASPPRRVDDLIPQPQTPASSTS